LSPLTIGWSRYPLTESLAISASVWFLAEVINSLAAKKLRVLQLAVALATSIYIRPDTGLLAIAVPTVSLFIYKSKRVAITKSLLFVIMTSIPVIFWPMRNVFIGSTPLSMYESSRDQFMGYRAWVNTWAVSERERDDASLMNPAIAKFNSTKFLSVAEVEAANLVIAKLGSVQVDRDEIALLDDQFKAWAKQRQLNFGFLLSSQLYVSKAANLLFSPFSVWGLPLDINVDKRLALSALVSGNITELSEYFTGKSGVLALRLAAYAYQFFLFALFFTSLILIIWGLLRGSTSSRSEWFVKVFVILGAVVTGPRLLFFVGIGGLESRYLVEVVPWIECSLGLRLMSRYCWYSPPSR